MTCKDCIHYEICLDDGIDDENKPFAENYCITFKDKSHFVELPCNVGDKVWFIVEDNEAEIYEGQVYNIAIGYSNWISARYKNGLRFDHEWKSVGIDLFLIREEAEKKLEEMKK